MKSPGELWELIKHGIKKEWKTAFLSAFLIGLLIHLPIMLRDIPNHDGLGSMYFDQNMITSGRWFLTVACGFSSYYTLPWVIGIFSLIILSVAAAAVTEFMEIKSFGLIIAVSGLLVSFPSMASAFAYVFTMDGYMIGLLLAVLAALLTKKYKWGFAAGGICLAFSLGTYQAYLPFAILLSMYGIVMILLDEAPVKEKIRCSLSYLYMGIIGVVLYYGILQLLLMLQGKQLASYQGIDGMGQVGVTGLLSSIKQIYRDFISFTIKGNVMFHTLFSIIAICVMGTLVLAACILLVRKGRLWKNIWFYPIVLGLAAAVPVGCSVILIISPKVNYHLLMRHQWVLFLIIGIGFVEKYFLDIPERVLKGSQWLLLVSASVLVLHYAVTDNIAYSNLEKRYEKTYAYCIRLLDRMEQTKGYYQGIPVAMIGVVGDEYYPMTDITLDVTGSMIGIGGDGLLYTGENYREFMKNYLGVEINAIALEDMESVYTSDTYRAMDSFPGAGSMQVVDGVLYIKTENNHYD